MVFFFPHWVMSLTSYENGVAIVKRLRTTGLDRNLNPLTTKLACQPLDHCEGRHLRKY
jgi:hypothetical protein